MTDFTKQAEQMTEMFKAMVPQVKTNKNGYEIRTKILEMAKDTVWNDFHAKFAGWEQTVTRDPESGEVVTTVTMPEVPGADKVLEAAEKFYAFVNQK